MPNLLRRDGALVVAVLSLLCVIAGLCLSRAATGRLLAESEARNRRLHSASTADRAELHRQLDAAARERVEMRARLGRDHGAILDALKAMSGTTPPPETETDPP